MIYPVKNYIYLHHINKYLFLPVYPESIQDTATANYNQSQILMRSAPLYAYQSSGPRTMTVSLKVHREVLNDINVGSLNADEISYYGLDNVVDYGDVLIRCVEACAVPSYSSSQKMVNPPVVSLKLGGNIFIKGVINGGVSATYSGPILTFTKDLSGKATDVDVYAEITLSFSINEITPYDATDILEFGSYRIKEGLERRIYSTGVSSVIGTGGGGHSGGRSFDSAGGSGHSGGRQIDSAYTYGFSNGFLY